MPETPRETHRSFTVRVPMSLYLEMSAMATRDNMHLNQKVNQLLRLGLGHHIQLDQQLVGLLRRLTAGAPEDE